MDALLIGTVIAVAISAATMWARRRAKRNRAKRPPIETSVSASSGGVVCGRDASDPAPSAICIGHVRVGRNVRITGIRVGEIREELQKKLPGDPTTKP